MIKQERKLAKKGIKMSSQAQNHRNQPGVSMNTDRNWNEQEINRLTTFLKDHQEDFITLRQRKISKIYKTMSQYMMTRNVNQCRSYVLKLLDKFETLEKALFFLEGIEAIKKPPQQVVFKQLQNSDLIKRYPRQDRGIIISNDLSEKSYDKVLDKKASEPTGIEYSQRYQTQVNTRKSFLDLSLDYFEENQQNNPFFTIRDIEPSPKQQVVGQDISSQKTWQECHQLFVAWVSCVSLKLAKQAHRQ